MASGIGKNAAQRGPLPMVVLAASGQDVRRCINCLSCEGSGSGCVDLTLNELMLATARNDPIALSCQTLWCDDLVERPTPCQANLDIPSVILVLRREAVMRGFTPDSRKA